MGGIGFVLQSYKIVEKHARLRLRGGKYAKRMNANKLCF